MHPQVLCPYCLTRIHGLRTGLKSCELQRILPFSPRDEHTPTGEYYGKIKKNERTEPNEGKNMKYSSSSIRINEHTLVDYIFNKI